MAEEKNDNTEETSKKKEKKEGKKLDFASFGNKILNMTIRLIVYSIVGGCFVYLTNIVNDRWFRRYRNKWFTLC